MARPSLTLCPSGFSTYTSLPALQASTVGIACQWSGVAIRTASTILAVQELPEIAERPASRPGPLPGPRGVEIVDVADGR